jgi:hypothetical protein
MEFGGRVAEIIKQRCLISDNGTVPSVLKPLGFFKYTSQLKDVRDPWKDSHNAGEMAATKSRKNLLDLPTLCRFIFGA